MVASTLSTPSQSVQVKYGLGLAAVLAGTGPGQGISPGDGQGTQSSEPPRGAPRHSRRTPQEGARHCDALRRGSVRRARGPAAAVARELQDCPRPALDFFSSLIYLPHLWQGLMCGSGFVGPFPSSEKRFCMGKTKNGPRPPSPSPGSHFSLRLGRGRPIFAGTPPGAWRTAVQRPTH